MAENKFKIPDQPYVPPSFDPGETIPANDPVPAVSEPAGAPVSLEKPVETPVQPNTPNPAPMQQRPPMQGNQQPINITPINANQPYGAQNQQFKGQAPMNQPNGFGAPNAPTTPPPFNPPPPMNQPMQQPKKKGGCLIPIIIVIVLVLILAIVGGGIAAFFLLRGGSDDDDSSSKSSKSTTTASVSTTLGSFDDIPTLDIPTEAVPNDESSTPSNDGSVDYMKLYSDFLGGLFNKGEDDLEISFSRISSIQYAIIDIDRDGREELLLSSPGSCMADMHLSIYDYTSDGKMVNTFSCFPSVDFLSNGALVVYASHNQGLAGDFWPFSLFTYDSASDSYVCKGYADAWSKELAPTGYDNEPYPEYIDKSKTGFVYYITPPDSMDETKPVDRKDFDAWFDQYTSGADYLTIPYNDLTESNLKKLDPSFKDTSGRPPEGDRDLAPSDMYIGEWCGSGKTIKRASMYIGPDTSYDNIITIPENDYVSIYGYNKKWAYVSYGSSTYTYSGYVKVEDISSELFGDAKGTLKINTKKDPLNMRSTPSMDGKVVGEIPKDQIVEYFEYTDGWYKVKYNGKEGYVSGDYVLLQ